MNNIDTATIIEKMINGTKTDQIKWVRLSDVFCSYEATNSMLKSYVISNERGFYLYNKDKSILTLNQSFSYCAKIDNGFVYLFEYINYYGKAYVIAVQSTEYSSIVEISRALENQSKTIELKYIIESKSDDYINFLKTIVDKF